MRRHAPSRWSNFPGRDSDCRAVDADVVCLSCLGKDCGRQSRPKLTPNDLLQLVSRTLLGVRLNILTTRVLTREQLRDLLAYLSSLKEDGS